MLRDPRRRDRGGAAVRRARADDLGPGLHWRWPWPVEQVTRVQPGRVVTVEVGFRVLPGLTVQPRSRSWSSPHGTDGLAREAEEAVMITGDGNLLESRGSLRYTVADPRAPVRRRPAGEGARNAAETVRARSSAAGRMADLLTARRGELRAR
ncbi:MAG: hypothetical protein U0736_22620 [Gemmataceae bacterium]